MQAGVCTTALDEGLRDEKLSNWKEQSTLEPDRKVVSFEGENALTDNHENLSNRNEKTILEPDKKAGSRIRNVGGDTRTNGKHSNRYKEYRKAVKTGKIKPTVYALQRHKVDGAGLGVETARAFLRAMERDGVINKSESGGKTAYIIA